MDTESAESIPRDELDGVSVYDWDADASDWAASNPNRLARGDLVYLVYDENGCLCSGSCARKPGSRNSRTFDARHLGRRQAAVSARL